MKANRWLCLLLAICLIFTLTACSGGGGGSSSDDPSGGGGGNGGNGGGGNNGGGGAGYPASLGPLCFTANTAGSTIKLKAHDTYPPSSIPTVQYSTDGENWNFYTLNDLITLEHQGDKVYFRGDNGSFCDEDGYMIFVMDGSIAASGNIMSLLDKTCELTTIPNTCCFWKLFTSCIDLTTAPELPATVLKSYCYNSMFQGCAGLTAAPELPAATLVSCCYEYMFYNCYNLETVPLIAATTLSSSCCDSMFNQCNNLNSITVNFIGWNGTATDNWVYDVAATGDFFCPASLATGVPGDFGDSKVPTGWTVHNP